MLLSFPAVLPAYSRLVFRPVSLLFASQKRFTRFLDGTVPRYADPFVEGSIIRSFTQQTELLFLLPRTHVGFTVDFSFPMVLRVFATASSGLPR